jgi:hypothetical protein
MLHTTFDLNSSIIFQLYSVMPRFHLSIKSPRVLASFQNPRQIQGLKTLIDDDMLVKYYEVAYSPYVATAVLTISLGCGFLEHARNAASNGVINRCRMFQHFWLSMSPPDNLGEEVAQNLALCHDSPVSPCTHVLALVSTLLTNQLADLILFLHLVVPFFHPLYLSYLLRNVILEGTLH